MAQTFRLLLIAAIFCPPAGIVAVTADDWVSGLALASTNDVLPPAEDQSGSEETREETFTEKEAREIDRRVREILKSRSDNAKTATPKSQKPTAGVKYDNGMPEITGDVVIKPVRHFALIAVAIKLNKVPQVR